MRVKIQNKYFVVNVHVLLLAECDMVLGIQWLRELGSVLWILKKLTMKFFHLGKNVEWKGLATTQLIEEGSLPSVIHLRKKNTNATGFRGRSKF